MTFAVVYWNKGHLGSTRLPDPSSFYLLLLLRDVGPETGPKEADTVKAHREEV